MLEGHLELLTCREVRKEFVTPECLEESVLFPKDSAVRSCQQEGLLLSAMIECQ